VIYNFFSAPTLRKTKSEVDENHLVSVLIPARNERENIEETIVSVLNQDYKNLEIIVLDDESNDGTFEILQKFSSDDKNIRILQGKKLPKGWIGKNWACHQLSESANGKFLLFIDADVKLKPQAVSSAIELMKRTKSKSVSVFPAQEIKSLGESFITPLMNWLLLTFLPLNFVHLSKNKSFVAANGQFFLFETDLYRKIGGHETVKNHIVEDMSLARLIKASDEKLITCLGGNLVSCRMYKNFNDGFNGFSKNFFPGFDVSPFVFFLFLSFIQIVFLLPIFLSFFYFKFLLHSLLIASLQILVLQTSKQRIITALLHPFHMAILFFVGLNSLIKTQTGNLTWKDRKIN
jgi:chlorobactene glucosyltransferase